MRIPDDTIVESPFMPNLFCLIDGKNMAYVMIAKVCSTFLRQVAVYYKTGERLDDIDLLHRKVGYTPSSEYLIPIEKMAQYEKENGKMMKFAVWKDPVKRLVSVYKFFCIEREYRIYFGYLGFSNELISFGRFLDFVEFELSKSDISFQDEHIRAQSSYYKKEDVDFIVPDYELNLFLVKHGVDVVVERLNETTAEFELDPKYISRIKELYRADYELL